jgi:putative endonuclease
VAGTIVKGKIAEHLALKYLLRKGYTFVSSNEHVGVGEIDLIVTKGSAITFVEVKSLHVKSTFNIYETLTFQKKLRLKRAILKWLSSQDNQEVVWKVDFIGIIYNKDTYWIDHFENVELD